MGAEVIRAFFVSVVGHCWSPLVTVGHFWSLLVTVGHFWTPNVTNVGLLPRARYSVNVGNGKKQCKFGFGKTAGKWAKGKICPVDSGRCKALRSLQKSL